jgi:uncharacterized membrane protein
MATIAATQPALRPRSQKKIIGFAVLAAVTVFVTFMKNRGVTDPSTEMAKHYAPGMAFLVPHAIFATVAYIMGAFQFSNRLRAKYPEWHRRMGYVYVACVFIGAPLAIPLAMKIGTPVLVAATYMQTFGWMFCTAVALYCIRNGNIKEHKRWMIRGYPFAVVFTVARVIIPIPPIFAMGTIGIEIVVWLSIAMAAFLPSIFLEWSSITATRKIAKA